MGETRFRLISFSVLRHASGDDSCMILQVLVRDASVWDCITINLPGRLTSWTMIIIMACVWLICLRGKVRHLI